MRKASVITTSPGLRRKRFFRREDWIGYAFCLPMLAGVILFTLYPMVDTFLLSLQQTNGVNGVYVGLDNYKEVLSNPDFYQAMGNTIYMGVLSIAIGFPSSFILACLINRTAKGKNFFKSVYFLPNIVSIVAISMIFRYFFAPTREGVLNSFLGIFGIAPLGWLTNPKLAGLSVVLMGCWQIGYDAIIFLAGLQTIPRELYEAAEIDGAGEFQKWRSVTIPCMRPIFSFMLIMMTISQLKRFSDVYVIGTPTGNPSGSLLTIVLYIYRIAFQGHVVGYASAAAYVLFVVVMVFTLINMRISRERA